MTAPVNQEHGRCKDSQINVRQQPIAQCTRAAPVDALARLISHYGGNSGKAGESRHPTHRQPAVKQMFVETVVLHCPNHQQRHGDRRGYAADVPSARQRIALMDVPPRRVALVPKYDAEGLLNLAKVFLWVDAYQRAGGTILFAGISRPCGACRI